MFDVFILELGTRCSQVQVRGPNPRAAGGSSFIYPPCESQRSLIPGLDAAPNGLLVCVPLSAPSRRQLVPPPWSSNFSLFSHALSCYWFRRKQGRKTKLIRLAPPTHLCIPSPIGGGRFAISPPQLRPIRPRGPWQHLVWVPHGFPAKRKSVDQLCSAGPAQIWAVHRFRWR